MDLSIIERMFALRDEVEQAQIGVEQLDLADLGRDGDADLIKRMSSKRSDAITARLLTRAAALQEKSEKWHADARTPDRRPRPEIVALLAAASAPLPVFDEAELASVVVPRAAVPAEPVVARRPLREPAREPVRDAVPRVADAAPKKRVRKTAKKKSKTPKKKPE